MKQAPRTLACVLILALTCLLTACTQMPSDGFNPETDLASAKVGVMLGESPDYILADAYPDANVCRYNSLAAAALALECKKVSCIFLTEAEAHYLMGIKGGFKILDYTFGYDEHMTITHTDGKLYQQFNEFVGEYVNSPEAELIHEHVTNMERGEYSPVGIEPSGTGEVLRIGVSPDYPPYGMYDSESGLPCGSDIDMITLFANKYNYQIEWTVASYSACMMMFGSGLVDMIMPGLTTVWSEDYTSSGYYCTEPFASYKLVFLVKED